MSSTGCHEVRSCGQSLEAIHSTFQRRSRDGAGRVLKNPTAVRFGGLAGALLAQWAMWSHDAILTDMWPRPFALSPADHVHRWSCMPETKTAALAQLQHPSVCWQSFQHSYPNSAEGASSSPLILDVITLMLAWIKQAFQGPRLLDLFCFFCPIAAAESLDSAFTSPGKFRQLVNELHAVQSEPGRAQD